MHLVTLVRAAAAILALALALPGSILAQQPADTAADRRAVMAVVDSLFTALKAKDTATFRRLHEPGARLVLTARRDTGDVIRVVPLDAFLRNIAGSTRELEERIFDPEVRIHDNLATVWNRYEFLVDGRPDHCGVDAFQLARFPEGWRVLAIADTQRPCS